MEPDPWLYKKLGSETVTRGEGGICRCCCCYGLLCDELQMEVHRTAAA
jgi:hypothetical protein